MTAWPRSRQRTGIGIGKKQEGADGNQYPVQLPRDVIVKLILALRRAVGQLPDSSPVHQESTVFEIARCHELVTTDRRMGLMFETVEGLEIPMALDQPAVDALSACIQSGGTASRSH